MTTSPVRPLTWARQLLTAMASTRPLTPASWLPVEVRGARSAPGRTACRSIAIRDARVAPIQRRGWRVFPQPTVASHGVTVHALSFTAGRWPGQSGRAGSAVFEGRQAARGGDGPCANLLVASATR